MQVTIWESIRLLGTQVQDSSYVGYYLGEYMMIRYLGLGQQLCRLLFGRVYDYQVLRFRIVVMQVTIWESIRLLGTQVQDSSYVGYYLGEYMMIRYLGLGQQLCRLLFGRVYDYQVLGFRIVVMQVTIWESIRLLGTQVQDSSYVGYYLGEYMMIRYLGLGQQLCRLLFGRVYDYQVFRFRIVVMQVTIWESIRLLGTQVQDSSYVGYYLGEYMMIRYLGLGQQLCRLLFGRVYDYQVLRFRIVVMQVTIWESIRLLGTQVQDSSYVGYYLGEYMMIRYLGLGQQLCRLLFGRVYDYQVFRFRIVVMQVTIWESIRLLGTQVQDSSYVGYYLGEYMMIRYLGLGQQLCRLLFGRVYDYQVLRFRIVVMQVTIWESI